MESKKKDKSDGKPLVRLTKKGLSKSQELYENLHLKNRDRFEVLIRARYPEDKAPTKSTIGRYLQSTRDTNGSISLNNFTMIWETLWGENKLPIPDWRDGYAELVYPPKSEKAVRFNVLYSRSDYFLEKKLVSEASQSEDGQGINVLDYLHQELSKNHIFVLSGLGGTGKTQAAIEYAFRHFYDQHDYSHVFWVNADKTTNLASGYANIAVKLGLCEETANENQKNTAVTRWFDNNNNWLLIFDNADEPKLLFETVSAALGTRYIPNNQRGKVLITSRGNDFSGLGIATVFPLKSFSQSESCAFLFQRTGRLRTKDEEVAANELAKALGGLPLALEQAAAYVAQGSTFRIYLNRYLQKSSDKERLDQLEEVKPSREFYHSSLKVTWAINFEAVTEQKPEAAALLKLSSFLAPDEIYYWMLIDGAKYLGNELTSILHQEDPDEAWEAIGKLLYSLWQYSLVTWEPEAGWYSLHRLVQMVMRENLQPQRRIAWIEQAVEAVSAVSPGTDFKNWPKCEQLLPHWLQIREQAHRLAFQSKALVVIIDKAGFFLVEKARYGEVEPLFLQVLAIRKEMLGENHPDVGSSLHNIAYLYSCQGRYFKAKSYYLDSLRITQNYFGRDHLDVATNLHSLGENFCSQGLYSESASYYKEALEIRQRLLEDKKHPDIALALDGLAHTRVKQGCYEDAESLCKQALDIRRDVYGDIHPHLAKNLNNLASIYLEQKRYDDAEKRYREALAMMEELFRDVQHPDKAQCFDNLGRLYGSQERYREAESLFKKALKIRQDLFGNSHPDVAQSLHNLAMAYIGQKLYHKVEKLLLQAMYINFQALGENHPDTQLTQEHFIKFLKEVVALGKTKILSQSPITKKYLRQLKQKQKRKKNKGFGIDN